jgi:molybdopterin-guanine dinucleotide biosynthesis protein A
MAGISEVMTGVRAYILAGGKSTRFGSDKARATVGGIPLIVRQAMVLQRVGLPPTVVADLAAKYGDLQLETIPDLEKDLGPIGGLRTALYHVAAQKTAEWVLLTSCDLLDLRASWLEDLAARRSGSASAVAFRGDRWEPMPALYHISILPAIEERIARRELALQGLLNSVAAAALPRPADWPDLLGANTPAELADYVKRWTGTDGR